MLDRIDNDSRDDAVADSMEIVSTTKRDRTFFHSLSEWKCTCEQQKRKITRVREKKK